MAELSKQPETKQTTSQAQAAIAAKDNARGAVEAAGREGAQAMEQGGRATSEAMRRGADAASDVTRQGTEAGAQTMRRAGAATGETVRRSAQAVVESQRQIVQDAAEKFEEVSRKIAQAAQGTTDDVRRLMSLPNVAEGGLRDLQQGMTGLVEGVVQANLRVAQELFRLSNPAAIIDLQQRFAREYMDTLMQNSATVIRAVRRTADETLRPFEEQARYRSAAE